MASFWRYVFDTEILQRHDLEELKQAGRLRARQARRRNTETRKQLEELEQEVGELRLFCRALLAYLQRTGTLDPAALKEVLLEIDAEDGTVDGRYDPPPPEPEEAPQAPKRRRKHT